MKQSSPNKKVRLAALILRKLSDIIRLEVKDPRLPTFITLTNVEVTSDLSHAKIYFTAFAENKELTTQILNQSAGFLRTALSRTLTTRTVPRLHFHYDNSLEQAIKIAALLKDVDNDSAIQDEQD